MKRSIQVLFLAFTILLSGCEAQGAQPVSVEPQVLTVMTHDSFAISEAVVAQFEDQHNIKVQFLKLGDAGSALNKAVLSRGNPLADVFYGVDNTFLGLALDENIFTAYASPGLEGIPGEFRLDPQNRALPVDYGDVCLNYDLAYFAEHTLPVPQNLDDLLKPEYRGLTVVQSPAFSSPGLAFLLTTIGLYGEDGYLAYWEKLAANDLLVVNDWESAYYTEFSVHGGTRPIVLSYGSSPPAEVVFAETPVDAPPSAVITGGASCFRQVEFAGILDGAKNPEPAKKWIDFMLSTPFQEDLPLQMFVYPVNPQAVLPEVFQSFAVIPEQTTWVSPQDIQAGRTKWIQDWSNLILK